MVSGKRSLENKNTNLEAVLEDHGDNKFHKILHLEHGGNLILLRDLAYVTVMLLEVPGLPLAMTRGDKVVVRVPSLISSM